MPRMAFENLPAPLGMDVTSDPVLMGSQRAQWLQNLLSDGPGLLRGVGFVDIPKIFRNAIDGMAWHYGVGGANDRLLVLTGGELWSARTVQPETTPPEFTDWNLVGGGFTTGKALRSAQYATETILVQEGGIQPKRYDGSSLYRLGIERPPAPIVAVNPPTSGTGNKRGRVTYKLSYADARLRESSLSDGTTVDYGDAANSGKAAFVPCYFGADPQVRYVHLYANLSGGSVWYRVGTADVSGDLIEDNLGDTSVSTGTVGPNSGQNDPPLAASCVAVHKNRVFLNSSEQPATLQISNAASITQWASLNNSAADGIRLSVTSDQSDGIAALVSFGSLLAIYKRQRIYQVWGDTPSTFRIVEIHQRGTTSPNSVARCDNVICALLDTAVYAAAYNDGFLQKKISEQLDAIFEGLAATAAGRSLLEHAQGAFLNNRYFLEVGQATFAYDFDSGEWTGLGNATSLSQFSGTGGTTAFGSSGGAGGAGAGDNAVVPPLV